MSLKKNSLFILVFLCYLSTLKAQESSIFDIARSGSLNELNSLIKKDLNIINKISKEGYSALTLACYYSNNEIANYLIKHVKDINSKSSYGTPLMAATIKKIVT